MHVNRPSKHGAQDQTKLRDYGALDDMDYSSADDSQQEDRLIGSGHKNRLIRPGPKRGQYNPTVSQNTINGQVEGTANLVHVTNSNGTRNKIEDNKSGRASSLKRWFVATSDAGRLCSRTGRSRRADGFTKYRSKSFKFEKLWGSAGANDNRKTNCKLVDRNEAKGFISPSEAGNPPGSDGTYPLHPSWKEFNANPSINHEDSSQFFKKEKPKCKMPRSVSSTIFFKDKRKQIDFVLAFRPGYAGGSRGTSFGHCRLEFEKQLKLQGLKLEYEGVDQSQDGKTAFVKIHADWDVLCRTAEINRVKMPIRANDLPKESQTDRWIEQMCGKNPFKMEKIMDHREPEYFTAAFSRDRIHQFLILDKDTFFSPVQRIRMVWDLILRTTIEIKGGNVDRHREHVGIKWMLKEKIYNAAFPVHDGDFDDREVSAGVPPSQWPLRKWLFVAWAKTNRWFKYQPLSQIRNYYGEKVAIYFAWLGFYTRMLTFPAAVGTLCFCFGLVTHQFDTPHYDICNDHRYGNETICRLCSKTVCPFKSLDSSCLYATLTYIFDNSATVFFALFVSIWAVVFLELWKRYQAELTWEWDTLDMEFVEESVRPEYQAIVKTRRINPVTQEEEPYLPIRTKVQRVVASGVSVVFMLFVVLGILGAIIFYRIVGSGLYYNLKDPVVKRISAPIMTSMTAAGINAICILILGKLYENLAWLLTSHEVPRTETDFENSYTYKVFIFEFINYYAALFYIAFIKGKIFGPPTSKGYVDRCDPVGCLIDVCIQLAIIMIVKQTLNNIMEIGWPVMLNWWKRRNNVEETEDNKYTRWEKDYDLSPLPQLGLFDEYLEMIIQYGFVTMFVAAFPLAPLFALLNNVIEIRLDAYKITTQFRRPVPSRARDIGAWFTVLEIITKMAVVTNGLVIAFTSDFIDRMVYMVVYSKDGSLQGYIEHVFSVFDTRDWKDSRLVVDGAGQNVTECWYRDYRHSPQTSKAYERTRTWWHVLVARLFFVLIFEHVVFLIQGFIQYMIPDIPEHVQVKIQRQNFLAKQALYRHEVELANSGDSKDDAAYVPDEDNNEAPLLRPNVTITPNGVDNGAILHRKPAQRITKSSSRSSVNFPMKTFDDIFRDESNYSIL